MITNMIFFDCRRSNLLTAKDYELSVYNYEYDPKKKRKICVKCYGKLHIFKLNIYSNNNKVYV